MLVEEVSEVFILMVTRLLLMSCTTTRMPDFLREDMASFQWQLIARLLPNGFGFHTLDCHKPETQEVDPHKLGPQVDPVHEAVELFVDLEQVRQRAT